MIIYSKDKYKAMLLPDFKSKKVVTYEVVPVVCDICNCSYLCSLQNKKIAITRKKYNPIEFHINTGDYINSSCIYKSYSYLSLFLVSIFKPLIKPQEP